MAMTRKVGIVFGIAVLSGMAALAWAAGKSPKANARPGGADAVLAKASSTEFGSARYGCKDTIAVAARVGVDYKKVVDLCRAKDKRGMHLLFWLTANAGLDAASAQGHAAVLGEVLRRTGDSFFANCLNAEGAKLRKAVREELSYDLGDEHKELRKYPKTFPKGSR